MIQTEMFPEFVSNDLNIPPDVQRDLDILSGKIPSMEPLAPNIDHQRKTAQERFLEERAARTEKVERTISNPEMLVLDLATESGRDRYKEFMKDIVPKAASDPKRWRITETQHPPMIDRDSPSGYRILVTVRYYECDEVKVAGDHGFGVIPRGG